MYKELREILKRVMPGINPDNYTPESRLVEDLKFDSLAFMAMASEFEATYGVEFEGPIPFKTVQDVMDFVQEQKRLGEK